MTSSKELPPLKRCNLVEDDKELPLLKKCKSVEDNEEFPSLKRFNSAEIQSSNVLEDAETSIKKVESDPLTHMDVISFLSNNGQTDYLVRSNGEFVRLEDAVLGKHLLICSATLPLKQHDDSFSFWRVLIDMYPELSQAGFECVVSITTKRNKKHAFDGLFSLLPCLAIPFSDLDTRKSVCSFIDSNFKDPLYETSAIVVNPTGIISSYDCRITERICSYRFEWFTRSWEDIDHEDYVLKIRLDPFYKSRWNGGSIFLSEYGDVLDQPVSLHKDILLCDPSRVLWRFCGADHQSLPVLELSNKYVGLYLCLNGSFMEQLNEAYKHCIQNNQEFEVVLVCLPFFEEPKVYSEKVFQLLKRYDIKSWFIFPYDKKACHRMWRVFCSTFNIDRLIILPPNCKSSGDLAGRAVIDKVGIDAYPFTRKAVLEQRVATLKSLTPASLFRGKRENHTCLILNGKKSKVPHSAIKGKKLILYMDSVQLSSDNGRLCSLLMKLYPKIQAKGGEVVFVPMNSRVGCPHHKVSEMPWPMMPIKTAIKSEVVDKLFYKNEDYCSNRLSVFGEDGKILSRHENSLSVYGLTKLIFCDYVREEISRSLELFEDLDI